MKKIIFLVLLLCVAGFARAELISNGDFEAGMSGWSSWGSGSGSGTAGYLWWIGSASIAPSGGYGGGQYAMLDTTPMDGYMDSWGWVWMGVWQSDLPAQGGQVLVIDGYAKDVSGFGATAHLFLEWEDSFGDRVDYDGDGTAGGDDKNEDRTHLEFPLTGGGSWEQINTTYTVPSVGGTGNPLNIAQYNAMWSIEAEPVSIGLDNLSISIGAPLIVYPLNGAVNVPTTAVLEWDPPPTFTPIAYDVYLTTDPNANKPEHLVVDHANQIEFDPDPNLAYNTLYYWRVNAYDPCDVIRTPGTVWTFTTLPTWPVFTTDIGSATFEAGSSAQFYVETPRTNSFQWWKEGTPDTQVNNGDDGGDISVVTDPCSSTLTISNVEQADEGYYYCVADNGDPCTPESNHARLLTKRLMGHWKFNAPPGNALNDEVAGNDGTLVDPNVLNPAPTLTLAAGINDQAIKLETGEIYVDIPNPDYFNFHAQGFTISGWVKTEQAGWGGIFSKADRLVPHTGWVLEHNSDTVYIKLRSVSGPGNDEQASYNAGLTDNEWHMLAGTYDGQTGMLALYVDGEKRDEAGPFWTPTETDMALKIGSELSSDDPDLVNTNPYSGLIDDVKIYSYAQDGYEIATAYTNYVAVDGGICVEPVPGDLNGDCVINTGDLVEVVLDWLSCDLVPPEACNE